MSYFSSADEIREREQSAEAARLSRESEMLAWRNAVAAVIAGVLEEFRAKATSSLPVARWDIATPEGLTLDSTDSIQVFSIPYFRSSTFSEQAYVLYLSRTGRYWARCGYSDTDGSVWEYRLISDLELPVGWIVDGWARVKWSSSLRDPSLVAEDFARELARSVGW